MLGQSVRARNKRGGDIEVDEESEVKFLFTV